MCEAVEDVPGRVVSDPNQRIVGRGLRIVAVHGSLREAVELCSQYLVPGSADGDVAGSAVDGRLPDEVKGAGWRVHLYVTGTIGKQHLSGGQHQHASLKGCIQGCPRRFGYLGQAGAVEFEEPAADR